MGHGLICLNAGKYLYVKTCDLKSIFHEIVPRFFSMLHRILQSQFSSYSIGCHRGAQILNSGKLYTSSRKTIEYTLSVTTSGWLNIASIQSIFCCMKLDRYGQVIFCVIVRRRTTHPKLA